jgi:hypothetical protein
LPARRFSPRSYRPNRWPPSSSAAIDIFRPIPKISGYLVWPGVPILANFHFPSPPVDMAHSIQKVFKESVPGISKRSPSPKAPGKLQPKISRSRTRGRHLHPPAWTGVRRRTLAGQHHHHLPLKSKGPPRSPRKQQHKYRIWRTSDGGSARLWSEQKANTNLPRHF